VRAEHCDVVVDFGAWPRLESLFTALSGARCTVGMRTPGQHRHAAYDVVVDHGTGHEIDNYRRLAAGVGIDSTSGPRLRLAPGASNPHPAPYVVLHLWPGGANFDERSWPADRWQAVAAALNARGYDVVLTGGPGDVEPNDALVREWGAVDVRAESVAGTTPAETLVWLAFAAGVISVNTGVMHVAAAVGTPVISLNGPTPVRRWGSIGSPSRAIVSPLVPDGYTNLGFEQDDRYRDAMSAISVETVVEAWDDLASEVDPGQADAAID
jgi:ADP-heptose:LPS heptosyltransferase